MTSKSSTKKKKRFSISKPSYDKEEHGYQKRAAKFVLAQAAAGLLLDPGLGKTGIVLNVLRKLKAKGMPCRALIIAPLRVCRLVWPAEIAKWAEFEGLTYTILHGKHKEERLQEDVDIFLINPEGLAWLMVKRPGERFALSQVAPDILVVDESSKFKKTNTQRFKLLAPFLDIFSRRIILTGSPMPNGYMDLFGQIYILDQGGVLGRYITQYRRSFFYPTGYGGYQWKLQEGADEKIQNRIKPLTLRLDAEDHITMPKVIDRRVDIELEGEALKAYKEMETLMITELDKGDVMALNAASAQMKCCQIANGSVYGERKEIIHHLHTLKAEAALDIVEELNGTPALIAYEFEHDRDRLLKMFGHDTPDIGRASEKDEARIERAWNEGLIPVMLGNPAAVGHGLNLQKSGNHLIWASLIWNYENYDQFNRRLRRQGAAFKTFFRHHIVARDTVDEAKMIALGRKHTNQKGFLDSLREYVAAKQGRELPRKRA